MNKIVIVTGTTKGIGRQTAHDLREKGYLVVGFDRTSDTGLPWKQIPCDLRSSSGIEKAWARFESEFDTPYALVNNAGIYQGRSWEQQTFDDFDEAIAINARAPFALSRLFASSLLKTGQSGVIINIASVSGVIGSIDVAYAASKAALLMISKSMAKALAPHGIRVISVSPGPVETEMAARIPEERKRSYIQGIPLKRFAEPFEISRTVSFLLSNDASYITGTDIKVDGGLV